MHDEYEPTDKQFEEFPMKARWEEEYPLDSGYRSDWGHYGNGNPMTRGEFYARQEILYRHMEELSERVESLENIIGGPKNFLKDLWASIWGRMVIIISTVIILMIINYLDWDPLRKIFDNIGF